MRKELLPITTVTLNRVTLVTQTLIDAKLLKHIRTEDRLQMLEAEDAYARRTILRAFGKTQEYEFECPLTWWDHLKFTLRARWPRLFKRLRVAMRKLRVDTGAVMTGLPAPTADRMIIPYLHPPTEWTKPARRFPDPDNDE